MESSSPNREDAGTYARPAPPQDPESIPVSSRGPTNFRTDPAPLPAGLPRRGPRPRKSKSRQLLSPARRPNPHHPHTNESPWEQQETAHSRQPIRQSNFRSPLPHA